MRFRRRAKLFPGVYLNFSKSGISTTIGVRGASVNFSKDGTYLNTGIPGTGIYDRQKIGGGRQSMKQPLNIQPEVPVETYLDEETGAIRTDTAEATTTNSLQGLKQTLIECYTERNQLRKEISKAKTNFTVSTVLMVLSYLLIFGLFIKWFKQNRTEKKEILQELEEQLNNCFVNIDMEVDEAFDKQYQSLLQKYKTLLSSNRIWDITSSVSVDQKATRSAASNSVTRRPVKFGFGNLIPPQITSRI